MAIKVDIDALKHVKNQEQMRIKIGKKFKTASLNSKFNGSKNKKCTFTC